MTVSATSAPPPPQPVHTAPLQSPPARPDNDNDNDSSSNGPARQPAPVAAGTGKIVDLSA